MKDTDLDHWPVLISCNGVTCGAGCGTPLINKPKGRKLPADITVIREAVRRHWIDCTGPQR